jgi:hypothetical protein
MICGANTGAAPDAANTFAWLVSVLRTAGIDFVVTGGVAARSYGADRPINDIDIDIRNSDFTRLQAALGPYVAFGPARYRDEKWDLLLMMLDHEGQVVDIAGGDDVRIYDNKSNSWVSGRTDFTDVEYRDVLGVVVPVMSPQALADYKRLLNGDHQKVDVAAIESFLKSREESWK